MITIPVRVCGDVWCDPEAFCEALAAADPQQSIAIDLKAEGPSIKALGVLDALRQHCAQTQRDLRSIQLINSPNNTEITEFENTHRGRSHFFTMCARYWRPTVVPGKHANRFAMFVGRSTVARCSMMFEISHDPELYPHFKLSTMHHDGSPIWKPYPEWRVLENFDDWLSAPEFDRMTQWWQHDRPRSIDGKKVTDQYSPDHNTNLSILDHYVHFHVELVAETYTLGDTFFPTEKTVRPIMAARPFLIYAAPGFLQRLKNLGFRTYDQIWDEDYDRYQGPERWLSIKKVLKDLSAMPESSWSEIMLSAAEIARHNRLTLAELVLDNKAAQLRDLPL